jgi:hypothetical protein
MPERVVFDTNVVASGLLWRGKPYQPASPKPRLFAKKMPYGRERQPRGLPCAPAERARHLHRHR